MLLRNIRLLAASVFAAAAIVATPSRSDAAIEVLIQEIGPGGTTTLLSTTAAPGGQVTTSSASFSTINLQFGNVVNNFAASFSTSYTITTANNLDISAAPQLAITVKDTGPSGNGIPALAGSLADLGNSVSVTNGILTSSGFGTHTLSSTTSLLDFDTQTTQASTGPDAASATNVGSGNGSTVTGISNLSEAYIIQQMFNVNLSGTGTASASTFTGGVSSTLVVSQAAIPAPPAILLAAMALPAFGLRRVLRRKTA